MVEASVDVWAQAARQLLHSSTGKLSDHQDRDKYVPLAFALVFGAGACTVLGSLLSLCAKVTNDLFLAGSLGLAAGVMLYVSLAKILAGKAVGEFVQRGSDDDVATRWAYFYFFIGIAIIGVLDYVIHLISKKTSEDEHCHACPAHAVPELEQYGTGAQLGGAELRQVTVGVNDSAHSTAQNLDADFEEVQQDVDQKEKDQDKVKQGAAQHKGKLKRMGILTGIAIALHNVPEGLLTFVATVAEPTAGVVIALAIALHNIPEGVCVAMPVYYATNSRFYSIFWATISGLAEPVGGLIGYILIKQDYKDPHALYGGLFGTVAGMMVYIVIKELLPVAYKFDPNDKITTLMVVLGMGIMASSLLLFAVA